MARLRLFASLREIAGTSRVEVSSDTVGGVIAEANRRFGPDFQRGVEVSRVWVNGETASPEDPVGDADEVVLLPPVSGGGRPVSAVAPMELMAFVPLAVIIIAVLASRQSQEIWAAAVVALVAAWAVDLGLVFEARGRYFAPLAVVTTSAGSAMAAHVLGGAGYGLALGVAVAVSLGWAVAFPRYRDVEVFSPVLLVSVFAGLGTASALLVRSAHSPDPRVIDVFLVAVIAGLILGALVERAPSLPFLDPFSVTAIGSILAAIGAAALWDLDVVGYLLVGLAIAVSLVAGRGLSSMLRLGRVALTERVPGVLSSLEGVAVAAAVLYPLVRIVL